MICGRKDSQYLWLGIGLMILGLALASLIFTGCRINPTPTRPTEVVKICTVSGLLAGDYCPKETVLDRRYYLSPKPGEPVKPTTVCSIHQAPEVIPVADTTAPRTGVDYYQLITADLADIKQYLNDLVLNGGSVLRVFMMFTWGDPGGWQFSPYKQVGWYTETSGAHAGERFPIFTIDDSDLFGSCWNEPIWEKWRAIFALCRERKIQLTISVVDGCVGDGRHYPPIMNYQHIGAEGPGTEYFDSLDWMTRIHGLGIHTGGTFGGFGEDRGTQIAYFKKYLEKVVAEVSASGVDFRIGTNELQCALVPEHDQAYSDMILHDYLKFIIDTLNAAGVRNNQITLSIAGTYVRGRVTAPIVAGFPGVVEQQHGPNSPETLKAFLAACSICEMDGDGFDCKAVGYINEYGYSMPSIGDTANFDRARHRPVSHFHGLCRGYRVDGYQGSAVG
jgi:hypothetical protein